MEVDNSLTSVRNKKAFRECFLLILYDTGTDSIISGSLQHKTDEADVWILVCTNMYTRILKFALTEPFFRDVTLGTETLKRRRH